MEILQAQEIDHRVLPPWKKLPMSGGRVMLVFVMRIAWHGVEFEKFMWFTLHQKQLLRMLLLLGLPAMATNATRSARVKALYTKSSALYKDETHAHLR
jgi:hypothetical protein